MAVKIAIKDLIPLLPLRVVCRIWDTVSTSKLEFLSALEPLGLDLTDVTSAEGAVDALYRKFTGPSTKPFTSESILTSFEKTLKVHLSKEP